MGNRIVNLCSRNGAWALFLVCLHLLNSLYAFATEGLYEAANRAFSGTHEMVSNLVSVSYGRFFLLVIRCLDVFRKLLDSAAESAGPRKRRSEVSSGKLLYRDSSYRDSTPMKSIVHCNTNPVPTRFGSYSADVDTHFSAKYEARPFFTVKRKRRSSLTAGSYALTKIMGRMIGGLLCGVKLICVPKIECYRMFMLMVFVRSVHADDGSELSDWEDQFDLFILKNSVFALFMYWFLRWALRESQYLEMISQWLEQLVYLNDLEAFQYGCNAGRIQGRILEGNTKCVLKHSTGRIVLDKPAFFVDENGEPMNREHKFDPISRDAPLSRNYMPENTWKKEYIKVNIEGSMVGTYVYDMNLKRSLEASYRNEAQTGRVLSVPAYNRKMQNQDGHKICCKSAELVALLKKYYKDRELCVDNQFLSADQVNEIGHFFFECEFYGAAGTCYSLAAQMTHFCGRQEFLYWANLGLSLLQTREWGRAINVLNRALSPDLLKVQLDPLLKVRIWYRLGIAYSAFNNTYMAIRAMVQALRIDPQTEMCATWLEERGILDVTNYDMDISNEQATAFFDNDSVIDEDGEHNGHEVDDKGNPILKHYDVPFRWSHAMVPDEVRNKIYLLVCKLSTATDGENDSGRKLEGSLHSYDINSSRWTSMAAHEFDDEVVKRTPHISFTLNLVPSRNWLVIIGAGQVLVFDTAKGILVKPLVSGAIPPFRAGHTTVNVQKDSLLLYGGFSYLPGRPTVYSDLHRLDTETMTWFRMKPGGNIPPARFSHVSFTLSENILVIFGGSDGAAPINTTHIYDLETNEWLDNVITESRPPVADSYLICGQLIPWHNAFLFFNNAELNSENPRMHLCVISDNGVDLHVSWTSILSCHDLGSPDSILCTWKNRIFIFDSTEALQVLEHGERNYVSTLIHCLGLIKSDALTKMNGDEKMTSLHQACMDLIKQEEAEEPNTSIFNEYLPQLQDTLFNESKLLALVAKKNTNVAAIRDKDKSDKDKARVASGKANNPSVCKEDKCIGPSSSKQSDSAKEKEKDACLKETEQNKIGGSACGDTTSSSRDADPGTDDEVRNTSSGTEEEDLATARVVETSIAGRSNVYETANLSPSNSIGKPNVYDFQSAPPRERFNVYETIDGNVKRLFEDGNSDKLKESLLGLLQRGPDQFLKANVSSGVDQLLKANMCPDSHPMPDVMGDFGPATAAAKMDERVLTDLIADVQTLQQSENPDQEKLLGLLKRVGAAISDVPGAVPSHAAHLFQPYSGIKTNSSNIPQCRASKNDNIDRLSGSSDRQTDPAKSEMDKKARKKALLYGNKDSLTRNIADEFDTRPHEEDGFAINLFGHTIQLTTTEEEGGLEDDSIIQDPFSMAEKEAKEEEMKAEEPESAPTKSSKKKDKKKQNQKAVATKSPEPTVGKKKNRKGKNKNSNSNAQKEAEAAAEATAEATAEKATQDAAEKAEAEVENEHEAETQKKRRLACPIQPLNLSVVELQDNLVLCHLAQDNINVNTQGNDQNNSSSGGNNQNNNDGKHAHLFKSKKKKEAQKEKRKRKNRKKQSETSFCDPIEEHLETMMKLPAFKKLVRTVNLGNCDPYKVDSGILGQFSDNVTEREVLEAIGTLRTEEERGNFPLSTFFGVLLEDGDDELHATRAMSPTRESGSYPNTSHSPVPSDGSNDHIKELSNASAELAKIDSSDIGAIEAFMTKRRQKRVMQLVRRTFMQKVRPTLLQKVGDLIPAENDDDVAAENDALEENIDDIVSNDGKEKNGHVEEEEKKEDASSLTKEEKTAVHAEFGAPKSAPKPPRKRENASNIKKLAKNKTTSSFNAASKPAAALESADKKDLAGGLAKLMQMQTANKSKKKGDKSAHDIDDVKPGDCFHIAADDPAVLGGESGLNDEDADGRREEPGKDDIVGDTADFEDAKEPGTEEKPETPIITEGKKQTEKSGKKGETKEEDSVDAKGEEAAQAAIETAVGKKGKKKNKKEQQGKEDLPDIDFSQAYIKNQEAKKADGTKQDTAKADAKAQPKKSGLVVAGSLRGEILNQKMPTRKEIKVTGFTSNDPSLNGANADGVVVHDSVVSAGNPKNPLAKNQRAVFKNNQNNQNNQNHQHMVSQSVNYRKPATAKEDEKTFIGSTVAATAELYGEINSLRSGRNKKANQPGTYSEVAKTRINNMDSKKPLTQGLPGRPAGFGAGATTKDDFDDYEDTFEDYIEDEAPIDYSNSTGYSSASPPNAPSGLLTGPEVLSGPGSLGAAASEHMPAATDGYSSWMMSDKSRGIYPSGMDHEGWNEAPGLTNLGVPGQPQPYYTSPAMEQSSRRVNSNGTTDPCYPPQDTLCGDASKQIAFDDQVMYDAKGERYPADRYGRSGLRPSTPPELDTGSYNPAATDLYNINANPSATSNSKGSVDHLVGELLFHLDYLGRKAKRQKNSMKPSADPEDDTPRSSDHRKAAEKDKGDGMSRSDLMVTTNLLLSLVQGHRQQLRNKKNEMRNSSSDSGDRISPGDARLPGDARYDSRPTGDVRYDTRPPTGDVRGDLRYDSRPTGDVRYDARAPTGVVRYHDARATGNVRYDYPTGDARYHDMDYRHPTDYPVDYAAKHQYHDVPRPGFHDEDYQDAYARHPADRYDRAGRYDRHPAGRYDTRVGYDRDRYERERDDRERYARESYDRERYEAGRYDDRYAPGLSEQAMDYPARSYGSYGYDSRYYMDAYQSRRDGYPEYAYPQRHTALAQSDYYPQPSPDFHAPARSPTAGSNSKMGVDVKKARSGDVRDANCKPSGEVYNNNNYGSGSSKEQTRTTSKNAYETRYGDIRNADGRSGEPSVCKNSYPDERPNSAAASRDAPASKEGENAPKSKFHSKSQLSVEELIREIVKASGLTGFEVDKNGNSLFQKLGISKGAKPSDKTGDGENHEHSNDNSNGDNSNVVADSTPRNPISNNSSWIVEKSDVSLDATPVSSNVAKESAKQQEEGENQEEDLKDIYGAREIFGLSPLGEDSQSNEDYQSGEECRGKAGNVTSRHEKDGDISANSSDLGQNENDGRNSADPAKESRIQIPLHTLFKWNKDGGSSPRGNSKESRAVADRANNEDFAAYQDVLGEDGQLQDFPADVHGEMLPGEMYSHFLEGSFPEGGFPEEGLPEEGLPEGELSEGKLPEGFPAEGFPEGAYPPEYDAMYGMYDPNYDPRDYPTPEDYDYYDDPNYDYMRYGHRGLEGSRGSRPPGLEGDHPQGSRDRRERLGPDGECLPHLDRYGLDGERYGPPGDHYGPDNEQRRPYHYHRNRYMQHRREGGPPRNRHDEVPTTSGSAFSRINNGRRAIKSTPNRTSSTSAVNAYRSNAAAGRGNNVLRHMNRRKGTPTN